MLSRRLAFCLLALIASLVVACSSNSQSPAPTSPTTALASTTIDLGATTPAGTPGAGTTAPVVGTVSGLGGTCPAITFVLSGVTIQVTGATTFEGGTCADIQNGVRAGAIGKKNDKGVIEAARVKIGASTPPPQPPQPPKTPPTPTPSVSGVVTGLSGACPAVTFTLSGTTVVTSASTKFEGGTCDDVKNGVRAGASGEKNDKGILEAAQVKVAGSAPPPQTPKTPAPPAPLPAVSGTVTGLSGACPALTFTLSGTTVVTSASTKFEGGACSDVKDGARAGAAGPKDASGAINAEHVKIAPPPTPAVTGTVASTSGGCPTLTFVVNTPATSGGSATTTTVRVTDKTRFEGGTCADIAAGVRVGVVGPKAADGAIEAVGVKIAPPR